MARFLLAGGGTGGHIFPLVAVAQALRSLRDGTDIVFVGSARGLEKRILNKLGERLELLNILPIKGAGLGGALRGITRAALSLPASRNLVRKIRPDCVLSIGGYAAGPVSLAARWMGIPLALLEPNSVLGLANRLLAPLAQRAYVAFPQTARRFRPSQVRQTGVPLRQGFLPVACSPGEHELRVLVLGGSQGAITLNRNVPGAIGLIRRQADVRVVVVHQSGEGREGEVAEQYERCQATEDVEIVPFIDDVPSGLAAADVVIQRAGASALAEVCAIGRASILIPYPYAAGNHQLHNAMALARAGAAYCIPSPEATPERIASHLGQLVGQPERVRHMAESASVHGRPRAASDIARDLFDLAEVT